MDILILLDLFIGFLKVGLFSFGGAYAAIPLIRDVVLSYHWLDDEMLTYMIAVSESTPGPIMVNIATYVGNTLAGIPGALVATFAVVLPAFIIIIALTASMSKFLKNRYVSAVIGGLKPSVIGIIFAMGVYMIIRNVFTEKNFTLDFRALIITGVLALLYFGQKKLKIKISPIMLIVISAICGMIGYGITL